MAVLSGSATIRFGVADTSSNLMESTYGSAKEPGGLEIKAQAGDFFVIPAGVAHKTYDTTPSEPFALLTPGDGHIIQAADINEALSELELTGYTMMGAYPINCGTWDFQLAAGSPGDFETSWNTTKPDKDPVLGDAKKGVNGQWKPVMIKKTSATFPKL